MKNNILHIIFLFFLLLPLSCTDKAPSITVTHDDDNATVTVAGDCRYLMIPVQESSWEVRVRLADAPADVPAMDIRMAKDSVDYYVPFPLPKGRKVVRFEGLWDGAISWSCLKTADKVEEAEEKYRPVYHHSPTFGWMNDPNGMFFKDGEYHLFYQYNPYGCVWGNMHWGHSVSKNLVHWEEKGIALTRDSLGHIYSGSAVIDRENTSGFGKDAVVAFYTAHKGKSETQCLAFSNDNGTSFTKYHNNPVVRPSDGLPDFRDPKVFWYSPENKWVMVVAAVCEVRFYSSPDLKNWEYTGCFGKGYGPQPSLFECPDLVKLPVDGGMRGEKWMLIVNVNPGGVFGGSATQYFIGEFDGRTFRCDTAPEVTKWLDYGKDHYAAVTFSGTGDRTIAMAWMSNWQYADKVPTRTFRSANTIARELSLFSCGDDIYAASAPVREMDNVKAGTYTVSGFDLREGEDNVVSTGGLEAYELSFNVTPQNNSSMTLQIGNSQGENVKIILDTRAGSIAVDRSESGLMTERENFNTRVSAPLPLCSSFDGYDFDIYLDRSSIEIFIDGGRIAITELVFPESSYDTLTFSCNAGSLTFDNLIINEIKH